MEKINLGGEGIRYGIVVFVIAGILLLVGLYVSHSIDKKDSWTRTLCQIEEGKYVKGILYNKCIIDGEEFRAKFVYLGTENNNTNSREIYEWGLVGN